MSMRITRYGRFERTDIWREGKWLDLWSVVHLISGVSIGLAFYPLHFGASATTIIVLLGFIAYEMWEKIVGIIETPTNRVTDIVVGMVSFVPTFYILAPRLNETYFIIVFVLVFTVNIMMSVFGWSASQKAAEFEKRTRARYARERLKVVEEAARLRTKLRLKKPKETH